VMPLNYGHPQNLEAGPKSGLSIVDVLQQVMCR